MTMIDYCDHGHKGGARRLDTGGGSGVYLCRKHWVEEMNWRKLRNEELEPQNQFDILPFPNLLDEAAAWHDTLTA